jgi:hypothetical protein
MHPFIQCLVCINYQFKFKCLAFPKGIPEEILINKFDHTKKHPDQKNNIVFEKE